MVLNDRQIEVFSQKIGLTPPLIEPFNKKLLTNCTYSLTIGEIIKPETGEVKCNTLETSKYIVPQGPHILKPNECVLVVTAETVQMPQKLMASYTPLNRNARIGLMLINPSVIEPGYSGPLSCVLFNLSADDIPLSIGKEIAKIVFFQLSEAPEDPKPFKQEKEAYTTALSEVAIKYHQSFMNIDGLVDKAQKAAVEGVKQNVYRAGWFIAILLTFATLEPFIAKWTWGTSGAMSPVQIVEAVKTQSNLEKAQMRNEYDAKEFQNKKEIDALRSKIENLENILSKNK